MIECTADPDLGLCEKALNAQRSTHKRLNASRLRWIDAVKVALGADWNGSVVDAEVELRALREEHAEALGLVERVLDGSLLSDDGALLAWLVQARRLLRMPCVTLTSQDPGEA